MKLTTLFLTFATLMTSLFVPPCSAQEHGSSDTKKTLIAFTPEVPPELGASLAVGHRPSLETIRVSDDFWICGDGRITTPLPVGYPRPTAVGAIEIKSYPSIRRAEVSSSGRADTASNMGFWKLFNHIKSRDIAMTAPVEMEYRGVSAEGSDTVDGWSMAFLYREPSLGPTGEAGDVQVVDSTPTTYLSIGALGSYGVKDAMGVLKTLRQALAELPTLEATGDVRVLQYNGPDVRNGKRWFEVQIPVRFKSAN